MLKYYIIIYNRNCTVMYRLEVRACVFNEGKLKTISV